MKLRALDVIVRGALTDADGLASQLYETHSVRRLHAGVVIVVQRFRYDLGLFVHLHALVTDGAFAVRNDDSVH